MRVHGQAAVEAQEKMLAMSVHRAHGTAGELLRPALGAMAGMGSEDLIWHPRLEYRTDPGCRVVDGVALGHPPKISQR